MIGQSYSEILFIERNMIIIRSNKMNKFVIALVCALLLASSYAFKAKTTMQTATSLTESAEYGYPVGEKDRPMGYTSYEKEEYFEDCPADWSKLTLHMSRIIDTYDPIFSKTHINHLYYRPSKRIRWKLLRQSRI